MNLQIGTKIIGANHPCFIIAEAGVNHNGDLAMALKLVDAAKYAGADAIKFQLFSAKEQLSKEALTAEYQKMATGNQKMLKMAETYDLPWEAHREIAHHCKETGILYMASCFDIQAVDFLLEIGGNCIKVGSGEITNYPLLAFIAGKEKPILLSTGMSTLQDIAGAVEWVQENGNAPLALFHCTSNYPAAPDSVNLRVMKTLEHAFQVPVGYSDHTIGDPIPLAAVALGASMLEKHFTMDRNLSGPDHAMSMEPDDLKALINKIRIVEMSMGNCLKKLQPTEVPVQKAARRSLVAACQINAGEALIDKNVTFKRPGTGIDPRLWPYVQGRTAAIPIAEDTLITWEMLL